MLLINTILRKRMSRLHFRTCVLILTMLIFHHVAPRTVPDDIDYDNYDDDDTDEDEDDFDIQEETTTEAMSEDTKFTFADDDVLGPLHWRNVNDGNANQPIMKKPLQRSLELLLTEDDQKPVTTIPPKLLKKLYANNHCQINWISPINIETYWVRTPELKKDTSSTSKQIDVKTGDIPETLIIRIAEPNVQLESWALGHPTTYHGIEIRSNTFGIIQIMDNFDPLPRTNSFTTFNFHFLSLFYCDLKTAFPYRTMHQIDGKRYPIELEFVFFKKLTDEEKHARGRTANPLDEEDDDDLDKGPESIAALYDGEYQAVIVAVMGEIGRKDNKYFQPVVEAAGRFHGKDFKYQAIDYKMNVVNIEGPWSPTWLLPDSSDYYYYEDGSFPVPPCWTVSRYYILRERIQISQTQLDALTHIRTDREKKTRGLLPCTHSVALHHNGTLVSGETPVKLNLIEFEMQGSSDGKPRSDAEKKERMERKRKREIFRSRLAGRAVNDKLLNKVNEDDIQGSSDGLLYSKKAKNLQAVTASVIICYCTFTFTLD